MYASSYGKYQVVTFPIYLLLCYLFRTKHCHMFGSNNKVLEVHVTLKPLYHSSKEPCQQLNEAERPTLWPQTCTKSRIFHGARENQAICRNLFILHSHWFQVEKFVCNKKKESHASTPKKFITSIAPWHKLE